MPDILNVTYAQTGNSSAQNALGMREMQARAYEKRNAQFLLLKAPPASGKSRALMFLALDKIHHQGLTKVRLFRRLAYHGQIQPLHGWEPRKGGYRPGVPE